MMQNHTGHVSMDPELQALRFNMQDRMCKLLESKWFERKQTNLSSEWKQRLSDIAKRLEESIFKESLNKDDYMSKCQSGIESPIKNMLNKMKQNQQEQQQLHQQQTFMAHHNIESNSSVSGMMIPTPGMMISHNPTGTMPMSSSMESNQGINPTSGPAGTMSNGYQLSHGNMSINQLGNTSMSASIGVRCQVTPQMIPTSGFNSTSTTQVTQQTMPMNSDYNNGSGILGSDSTMPPLLRINMQYNICKWLERKYTNPSSEWKQRLTYLAKKLEESIFKESHNKDDYMSKFPSGIESRIINVLNQMKQNQQRQPQLHQQQQNHQQTMAHHNIQSNSSVSGIIPTSGPAGTMSNGYQLSHGNMSINQPGSTSMSASIGVRCQVTPQMIPTSGFNSTSTTQVTQQTMPMDYAMLPLLQPQKKQQVGQVGPGMQSVPMNQKHSSQGYMGIGGTYGNSTKPLQQGFSSQQIQQRMPTSLSQQGVSLMADNTVDMTMSNSGNYYNPAGPSNMSSASNLNKTAVAASLQSKPRPNMLTSNHQAGIQQPMISRGGNNTFSRQSSLGSIGSIGSLGAINTDQVMAESHNSNASIEKNQIDQNKLDQSCMTISSEGVRAPGPTVTTTVVPHEGSSQLSQQETQHLNLVKLILFLFHAKYCPAPAGRCPEKNCVEAQLLLQHIERCYEKQCGVHLCLTARKVLLHFHNCREENCPVCIPARKFLIMAKKGGSKKGLNGKEETAAGLAPVQAPVALPASASAPLASKHSQKGMNQLDSSSNQMDAEPLPKRQRMDMDISPVSVSVNNTNLSFSALQEAFPIEQSTSNIPALARQETDVKIDRALQNLQIASTVSDMSSVQMGYGLDGDDSMIRSSQTDGDVEQEPSLLVENKERNDENTSEAKQEEMEDEAAGKIKAVSMMELFTPEQVREHMESLKQGGGQRQEKTEGSPTNSCQLCRVEKLVFDMVPIYCTPCGARIKKNGRYYLYYVEDHKHAICTICFHVARDEAIEIESQMIPKAQFKMKINDEQIEEGWVQCDKCDEWLHQICALFNPLGNTGDMTEYTCPKCYLHELERGERMPLPESAMLGAKDLPRTRLSDFIEERLFKRLEMERRERADSLGKRLEDVPGAEGLVLRVVSSVNMMLKVKPRFSEIFKESYPTDFPYKSKAIFLFQKIDGVEVSLFSIFVHEFGTECAFPNQRSVYISYVDSVKYFRPDIKTSNGEALRTFVFHEVLIGYLDWCKKRGFSSCYLWACPPHKGDDYIFYCHPQVQKTPKPDRLREWYLSMLRKGMKENIVVGLTNLYDHFFTRQEESRAKITAVRLPYFEGDYWPGVAEEIINKLLQEDNDLKQQRSKSRKLTMTKCVNLTGDTSKDDILMQKLGEAIFPMKDDFIMVHLQHTCNHCGSLIVSGTRWACNSCKCFNLCNRCFNMERLRELRKRHPCNSKDRHAFNAVKIGVPADTKDEDQIIGKECFKTRLNFLSLCQKNYYQYESLRRAKHSSMMVLYHLHHCTEPNTVL